MDLNGDGRVDILSGSYSRMEQDMAGLFQVLWGAEGGGFAAPETLLGTDGEPLIIPSGEDEVTERICTRPTAVDLDGDGDLDIVSGNFSGTFYLFTGEGKGAFAPQPAKLRSTSGNLEVPAHSDPFFVDWDGDGDQDMLSGSAQGGVFLALNTGSKTKPAFAKPVELIEPAGYPDHDEVRIGDGFLQGPQASTRVWAADLDGNGKLDLLVGDSVRLLHAVEGVQPDEARDLYKAWAKRRDAFYQEPRDFSDAAVMKEYEAGNEKLQEELAEFVREESTGFVWAFYRK